VLIEDYNLALIVFDPKQEVILKIDIIDEEIWIQRDGTEAGIAYKLIEMGIPKDKIVLGFRSEPVRYGSDLAVA
jgi:XisI protein